AVFSSQAIDMRASVDGFCRPPAPPESALARSNSISDIAHLWYYTSSNAVLYLDVYVVFRISWHKYFHEPSNSGPSRAAISDDPADLRENRPSPVAFLGKLARSATARPRSDALPCVLPPKRVASATSKNAAWKWRAFLPALATSTSA